MNICLKIMCEIMLQNCPNGDQLQHGFGLNQHSSLGPFAEYCYLLVCSNPHWKMAVDLTNFLLPSSRLPTDVTFVVSGKEVGAHKSFLAAAHTAFDKMFFEAEAGAGVTRVKVSY